MRALRAVHGKGSRRHRPSSSLASDPRLTMTLGKGQVLHGGHVVTHLAKCLTALRLLFGLSDHLEQVFHLLDLQIFICLVRVSLLRSDDPYAQVW